MADVRLVVVDLDTAFLTGHSDTHPENLRAMREAQQRGISVCVSTNRGWSAARYIVHKCGFMPFAITSGGAAVIDLETDEPVLRRTMVATAVLPLLYSAWVTGVQTSYVHSTGFTAGFGRGVEDRVLRTDIRNAVIPREDWEEFRAYTDFLRYFRAVRGRTELALMTGLAEQGGELPEKMAQIVDKLDAFNLSHPNGDEVAVVSKRVSKLNALEAICRHEGIDRRNVLVIGGQENDIPMLEWAGEGVAIGDAEECVCQAADRVTVVSRDAGVAKAIYESALGYVFD
ncbi:MAG: HAD hydrolase family protein [Clostridia bacterium]|nr:HAD hydrolase family protein [Clostridia bacterium]